MNRLCLLLALLFSGQTFADAFSVKTLSIKNADKESGNTYEYRMPFIEAKAADIASRLNDFIFILIVTDYGGKLNITCD